MDRVLTLSLLSLQQFALIKGKSRGRESISLIFTVFECRETERKNAQFAFVSTGSFQDCSQVN